MEPDWGRDPSVLLLRGAFRRVEEAQAELLRRVGISPLDRRLRRWRELALGLFQAQWRGPGDPSEASEPGSVYARCLAKVLAGSGVAVPRDALR